MSKTTIRGTLVTPFNMIQDGRVEVQGNKIVYAGQRKPPSGQLTEHGDRFILPGLIDIHVHGAMGYDFMTPTRRALVTLSRYLAAGGVTGFLATTYTSSHHQTLTAVKQLAQAPPLPGARLLGIHLEGPYINKDYGGAQTREHIRELCLEELGEVVGSGGELIKMVTLAPENEAALEAVRWLKGKGIIVSAGHTGATFTQFKRAADEGLSHVAHLFNGMRGLHHREPGIVGAALTDGRVSVELIADGLHLHPASLRMAALLKGASNTVLISDSIKPAGLSEGDYRVGDATIRVGNGELRLLSGALAGSSIRLNQALKTMNEKAGAGVTEATQMATDTPARILGLSPSKGRLAEGSDADLTVLDRDFKVQETWVMGEKVYP